MVAVLTRDQTKKGVAMQSTMPPLAVALPAVPFLFSPTSLYARFSSPSPISAIRVASAIPSRRSSPSLPSPNSPSICPEGARPRAIADWARLRAPPSPTCSASIARRCRTRRPGIASSAGRLIRSSSPTSWPTFSLPQRRRHCAGHAQAATRHDRPLSWMARRCAARSRRG